MTESLPETIGRFRILQVLGRGAMGVVYKAHDPAIDRFVAIKQVRLDLDDSDSHSSSIRNEAKAIGRIVHPNIVAIHDFSFHDGMPFLVLEFVDGRDLGHIWPQGTQVPLALATRVILQVLDALNYAHGFGIINRDIKPANIMVTDGLTVKVTDFGIAHVFASDMTRSSMLVGTPSYMAPEQCLGEKLDPRSDIFSLGCVFYELLAGRRCFTGETVIATTHRVLHEAPTPLRQIRPGLPDAVVQIIERALSKHPDDRYASAAAMTQALRAALRTLGLSMKDDPDTTVTNATLLVAGRSRAPELEVLNTTSLATIERRLAHYTGPMARLHIRRALTSSISTQDFVDRLALLVPEAAQDEMLQTTAGIIAADPAIVSLRSYGDTAASARLGDVDIAVLTRALAAAIGPIGSHILRRAIADGKSVHHVIEACAGAIERPDDQQHFRWAVAELKLGA